MQNQKQKKRNSNNFLRTLNILIVLSFIVVVVFTSRIAIMKTVGDTNLQEVVATRQRKEEVISANRGTIRDTKGNLLAQTIPTYNLFATITPKMSADIAEDKPKLHVVDPARVARELGPIIGMPEGDVLSIINYGIENDAWQVEFAPNGNGLNQVQKESIDALELEGVSFTEIDSRNYPQSRFASHIIGYASYDQATEHLEGRMGIEGRLEDYLRGTDGQHIYSTNANGLKLDSMPEIYTPSQDGGDVYLTLDTTIQRMLENKLIEIEQSVQMSWATIVVADPKTGAILGAAQSPSFDPNNKDISDHNNYLAQTEFEVGSIMKPITFASAIDVGRYNGEQGVMTGAMQIDDVRISDWNGSGWGIQAKDRGLCHSANTITADVVRNDLTAEEQRNYLKKFGFGQPTGIEIAGEASGTFVLDSELERVTTGFGQGTTATVMQMVQAYNAIANDGVMMQLHIVDKIVDPKTGEYIYKAEPKEKGQPISKATSDKVTDLLVETANDVNCASGDTYKMASGTFAGKTGTAEVVNLETGKYYEGFYTNTYAGFAPAEDPKFVLLSTVYLPTPNASSASTTPIITGLHDQINRYLSTSSTAITDPNIGIGQNAETIVKIDSFPSFLNARMDEFFAYTESIQARRVVVLGTGDTIIEQNIQPYTELMNTERIIVRTNSAEIAYPDFGGWSRRDIESFGKVAGVPINFEGYGYAVEQSFAPGTIINDEFHTITIKLMV